MRNSGPFSVVSVQKLVARVGVLRAGLCFLAVFVPIATLLSLLFAWLGPDPSPAELVLRGGVAFVAFTAGGALFLWLIARLGRSCGG